MKKLFLKIKNFILIPVLCLSIGFGSFTCTYYSAMELGGSVAWNLIQTLFFSLGVTFSLDGEIDVTTIDDAIVSDIRELAESIQDGTLKSPLMDAAEFIGNIINYWDDVTGLTIPQTIWEALKYYVGTDVASRPLYKPTDEPVNLYGCNYQEFKDYFNAYFGFAYDGVAEKYFSFIYDKFVAGDYTLLFMITDRTYYERPYRVYHNFILESGVNYAVGQNGYLYNYDRGYKLESVHNIGVDGPYGCQFGGFGMDYLDTYYETFAMIKGQVYNLSDISSTPIDATTSFDYGNVFSLDDFGVSSKEVFTGVTTNPVSDVMDVPSDAYDVLTPNRTWDEKENKVVGDVVLPLLDSSLIQQYYDGVVTWQDLLESMDVTPVDTARGETLDGGTISDAIVESSNNIIDVLKALPQVLLDGILGLFIPSEDFIQEKVGILSIKLADLGIIPYDMSDIFKGGDDNPFKDIKITVYGQEVTIVSFEYLPSFLNKFRPVIRGLMVLFMVFYSINQLLALLRLSGMMEGGNMSMLGVSGSDTARLTDKGGKV